jgi:hypothetical protein
MTTTLRILVKTEKILLSSVDGICEQTLKDKQQILKEKH